jgi:hypothetical protein
MRCSSMTLSIRVMLSLILCSCGSESADPTATTGQPTLSETGMDSMIGFNSPVYRNLPDFPLPPEAAPTAPSMRSAGLSFNTVSLGGVLIDGPQPLEIDADAAYSFAFGAASNGLVAGYQMIAPQYNQLPTSWSLAGIAAQFALGSHTWGLVLDVNASGVGDRRDVWHQQRDPCSVDSVGTGGARTPHRHFLGGGKIYQRRRSGRWIRTVADRPVRDPVGP